MVVDKIVFLNGINSKEVFAYQELIKSFYSYLVVYSMRYTHQRDASEDIVQELFISLWESEKKFNSYKGFASFLYDSVKNRSINYIEHQKVELKFINYSKREDIGEDDDEKLMLEELYRQLYKAIDELPPKCKEIFKLHLAKKKNEEIADILNISIETVKKQKKIAKKYLQEKLGSNLVILITIGII